MNAVTASPDFDTAVFPPLTLADRCCATSSGAAQALVRVVKGTKDLMLSGHAFSLHEAKLLADGWSVYEDIRVTAEEKPMAAY